MLCQRIVARRSSLVARIARRDSRDEARATSCRKLPLSFDFGTMGVEDDSMDMDKEMVAELHVMTETERFEEEMLRRASYPEWFEPFLAKPLSRKDFARIIVPTEDRDATTFSSMLRAEVAMSSAPRARRPGRKKLSSKRRRTMKLLKREALCA